VSTVTTLARAGMIVSGAFFVSRVLGWLRLVVIANQLPNPSELDAFFAAFRIPDCSDSAHPAARSPMRG